MTITEERPQATRQSLALALPSDAAVRFGVLVLLTVATSADLLITDLPWSGGWEHSFIGCVARSGLFSASDDRVATWQAFAACYGPDAAGVTLSLLATLAGGAAVVAGVFWLYPSLLRRRHRLVPLRPTDDPELAAYLGELVAIAGLARSPQFLVEPANPVPVGWAFGRVRRHWVSLTGGLITLYRTDRTRFRAIVLHELAHIRNGDVPLTYLALAIWRVFLVLVLLPYLVGTINLGLLPGHPGPAPHIPEILARVRVEWWRVLVLVVLVYLARNALLRAREHAADVRAATWDPAAAQSPPPAAPGPRWRPWPTLTHPTPSRRLAVIADPALTLRPSWWVGAAAGLATALYVRHFAVPLLLASPGFTRLMNWGLLGLFAVTVGGLLAILGWRAAAFVRLGGHPGRTLAPLCLSLAIGLLLGPWLDFLNPVTRPGEPGGVAGLIADAVLVLVLAAVGLYAYADATGWLADGRSARLGGPMLLTFAVCAACLAGWVGWWSRPSWQPPGVGAVVDAVRALLDPLGWGWLGWLPYVVVDVPAAIFGRDLLAQAAIVLVWLVPVLVALRWRSGGAAPVRAAAVAGLAGGAVAVPLVIAVRVVVLLLPYRAAGSSARPGIAIAFEMLSVVLVQVVVALRVYRRKAVGVRAALLSAYLVGLAGTAVIVVAGLVAGTSASGLARAVLSVPVDGGFAACLALLIGYLVRTRARARPEVSPAPDGAGARHGWRVPVAAAAVAVLAVGAASLVLADDRSAQVTAVPVSAPSLSPELAMLAMRAWMDNGGKDAIDGLDNAATALDATQTAGQPDLVALRCQQLTAAVARAKKLAALPGTDAQNGWQRTMQEFDQTVKGCGLPFDRGWPASLAFARVYLEIAKLFVLSVLKYGH